MGCGTAGGRPSGRDSGGLSRVISERLQGIFPEKAKKIKRTALFEAQTMTRHVPTVDLPLGEETVSVSLINPVNFGPAILDRFMAPAVPGLETFQTSPSLCFLLEHPSGRKLVWDLGIRKDYNHYAPEIAAYLPTTKYNIQVTKNLVEILEEHGVHADQVEAVIWSHWHWDHIGDPSTFPSTTKLIVGQGFKEAMLPGAPANPKSPILESDYAGRDLVEITFDGPQSLQIGKFPAVDYFGDGSFYLLDSPGHAVGHLCGLARTTQNPDTFVLLGGDVCHYAGIFRPSEHLPMPERISPHPCCPTEAQMVLCPGSAWAELQSSRGRNVTDTLFDLTFGLDLSLATKTVGWLQELDCNENVLVVIAHDSTVRDAAPHFPENLNNWKAAGLGRNVKWAFLRDLEAYWKSKGLA